MLTGGIQNNLSLIPATDHDQTWSDQISSTITSFKGSEHAEPPVFTLFYASACGSDMVAMLRDSSAKYDL